MKFLREEIKIAETEKSETKMHWKKYDSKISDYKNIQEVRVLPEREKKEMSFNKNVKNVNHTHTYTHNI